MTELDPEVVADLQLRAYSQHDRSRSRGAGAYDWTPPATVTQWKCRTPPCKAFVDVTEDGLERWEIFNRQLAKMGERPIESHTVLLCAACEAKHVEIQPLRLRKRVERMASVIRQLKAGDRIIRFRTNEGEQAVEHAQAFLWLHNWGHPDVEGLRQALTEKTSPNKKPTRGYV